MKVSQYTIDLIKQRMAVKARMRELSYMNNADRPELNKCEQRLAFLETLISSAITTDAIDSQIV